MLIMRNGGGSAKTVMGSISIANAALSSCAKLHLLRTHTHR